MIEKFHPPVIEESTTGVGGWYAIGVDTEDWSKSRALRECPDGIAVWAKVKKVTEIKTIVDDTKKASDDLSIYTKEVKTVVYERR